MKSIDLIKELDSIYNKPGCPIGKKEDIIRLSDSPYYTICPNPSIRNFLERYGRLYNGKDDNYHRKPFTFDVSEGKNDPIYMAHSYHTKVPHRAIIRYILHYTEPYDVIFDGFCGTGMTGVAALMCGDSGTIKSLGYHVDTEGQIYNNNDPFSKIGSRCDSQ